MYGFVWGFALQSKLQRLYKGWEVSSGRLVAQFIRRNVILVRCKAQTEPLQSDAGGAVDDEDCDGSSIPSYISTTFRATQKRFFKRKNKEKFKSYCNIVLFLLPGESFRKKLNNKKGSPFV